MNASAPKDQALSLPTPSTSQLDELLHMQSVDMVTIYQPPNPFDNNAALWLKHLPQGCTIPQLIQAISSVGPIGRILLGKILPPDRQGQVWAAKVVFATQKIKFIMDGRGVWVDWHRVLSSSFLALEPITRVLIIEGPTKIVNIYNLDRVFKWKLQKFDTEEVVFKELPAEVNRPRRASIIWRFGGWYGQAEIAVQQLEQGYSGIVEVKYGLDPCASPAPDIRLP